MLSGLWTLNNHEDFFFTSRGTNLHEKGTAFIHSGTSLFDYRFQIPRLKFKIWWNVKVEKIKLKDNIIAENEILVCTNMHLFVSSDCLRRLSTVISSWWRRYSQWFSSSILSSWSCFCFELLPRTSGLFTNFLQIELFVLLFHLLKEIHGNELLN